MGPAERRLGGGAPHHAQGELGAGQRTPGPTGTCPSPPALRLPAERRRGPCLYHTHSLAIRVCLCCENGVVVLQAILEKVFPHPPRNIRLAEGLGLSGYIIAGGMFISSFSFKCSLWAWLQPHSLFP